MADQNTAAPALERVAIEGIFSETTAIELNSRGATYSAKVTGEFGKSVAHTFALLDGIREGLKERGLLKED